MQAIFLSVTVLMSVPFGMYCLMSLLFSTFPFLPWRVRARKEYVDKDGMPYWASHRAQHGLDAYREAEIWQAGDYVKYTFYSYVFAQKL